MKTYLELSQDSGTAHKFYEVVVDGTTMTIRYGRIGTNGATSSKSFSSEEAAQKEAAKKIKAKKRKGYEEAIMGVRKKRAISRRSISSRRSTSKAAPVLWKFKSGSSAFGIHINEEHCWIGNENGTVFMLNHKGVVLNQYQLPDGVKCIIEDGDWVYVGCDDGYVYDLTGKLPRQGYAISENIDIYWLDVTNGLLAVSDRQGEIMVIDYEDEDQWSKKSDGRGGWMVRVDQEGKVYHGHSEGVTCYDGKDGAKIWNKNTKSVLFGWLSNKAVTVGTSGADLISFDKNGKEVARMKADTSIYSCATAPNDAYLFAGDSSSSIYCFNDKGERLWKLATTCGSAFSMQYFDSKIYIVTTDGSLTCIDASEEAIENAKQGQVPQYVDIKAPKRIQQVATTVLETATASTVGVKLICIKEGGKLRMRVLSEGYNQKWNVQFPKNLRIEGKKYIVDEIREASQGGFYRCKGDIYKMT